MKQRVLGIETTLDAQGRVLSSIVDKLNGLTGSKNPSWQAVASLVILIITLSGIGASLTTVYVKGEITSVRGEIATQAKDLGSAQSAVVTLAVQQKESQEQTMGGIAERSQLKTQVENNRSRLAEIGQDYITEREMDYITKIYDEKVSNLKEQSAFYFPSKKR